MATMKENPLTHIDSQGNPGMVDVGAKTATRRNAIATAEVAFPPAALATLSESGWTTTKGAVIHTAIIAGTQAVKKTSDLIPFCHPLPIERCKFTIEPITDGLLVSCEVALTHKTGVEMEALTGATIAALTIIDMCKAASPAITIREIRLLEKTGGKSDYHA
jgi:cyclic pyranopterin phosphate synthase